MNKSALSLGLIGIALTLTGCAATRGDYWVYDPRVNDTPPAHSISEDTTTATTLIQEQDEMDAIDASIQADEQEKHRLYLQQQQTIQTEGIDIPVDSTLFVVP